MAFHRPMSVVYFVVVIIASQYFDLAHAFRPSRIRGSSLCNFRPAVTELRKNYLPSSENEDSDRDYKSISSRIKKELGNIQDRNVGEQGRRNNYDAFGD